MKFVVAILVFSLICLGRAVSEEDKNFAEFIKETFEMCQEKHEISNEDIQKLMHGEFDKGGADDKVQCHINCMMEQFGALEDENNEVRKMFSSIIIDEAGATAIFKTCQQETGKDDCEKGYKVYMCLKANAHNIVKKE